MVVQLGGFRVYYSTSLGDLSGFGEVSHNTRTQFESTGNGKAQNE